MAKEKQSMTIHLPEDVERSIEAAVHGGLFASVDDAMAEAARLLLHNLANDRRQVTHTTEDLADPILGSMREDAALMDEIVEQAMWNRQHQPWRLPADE
jgi:Arc/MetJ-type ribon-helix-helix transcriptional regulator